jgi:hypothetical protein
MVRAPRGFLQGYNAQAICTETQVVIAVELSTDSPDGRLLEPMIDAARIELQALGIDQPPTSSSPTAATGTFLRSISSSPAEARSSSPPFRGIGGDG